MAGTGGRNTISSGILGSAALVQRHDGMPAAHFPASGALDFPRFYHGWMGGLFSLGWVSASGGHIIHSSIHPSILGLLPSARPAVLLCWFCCGVSDYSQNPFLDIFSIAIARQSLAEKRQRHSRSVLSVIEEGVLRCMREKDLEMEKMNHRNMELEERVKQLKMEAQIWQSKAKNQEAMVATLRNSLKQAVGQNRGQNREQSKEGCGDSEADDAESAHLDPNVEDYRAKPLRGSKDTKDQRTCKVCRKNDVSILLLPCRHLCLCRDCDIAVDSCPLCHSMKNASVEVYMS